MIDMKIGYMKEKRGGGEYTTDTKKIISILSKQINYNAGRRQKVKMATKLVLLFFVNAGSSLTKNWSLVRHLFPEKDFFSSFVLLSSTEQPK